MTGSLSQTRGRPEPGRELDALIAEKVMGLRRPLPGEYDWGEHEWYTVEGGVPAMLPRYSADIAAAFTVVEKLEASSPIWLCQAVRKYLPPRWCVEFRQCDWPWSIVERESPDLPHAICLAALAALSPADDGGAR